MLAAEHFWFAQQVAPVQQSLGPVHHCPMVPQQVPAVAVALVHCSARLQQAIVNEQAPPTSGQAVQVWLPGIPVHWRPRQHCDESVQAPALAVHTHAPLLQLPKQQSPTVLHAPPTPGSEH